jgi:Skp family chaperone for outer membrane proteins
MRGFVIGASLACAVSAAPVLAQTPPAQPPSQAKPAPTTPAAPAAQPAAPPAAAPAPAPPAPFPQGARVAYVNLQAVASLSAEGKAANAKVLALTQKKQAELGEKTKALQASQQKLQTGGTVMSEQASAALEKDIERQTRELERLQQDAQAELTELQQTLQDEFQKLVFPVLQQLGVEKGLHLLLNVPNETVIWGAEGLDLTMEAVKKLDALPKPTPKP